MKSTALGLAIAAAHAVGFAALAPDCRGTELAVELRAPAAAPAPALEGTVPAALARRVETRLSADAPGLVRRTWAVRYRGGFERAVGAAQLVGPFQDPAARACSGRIVVGQRLLDDGRAGPGTIAGEMAKALDDALRGEGYFGIGDYVRTEALSLRWAQLASHPEDVFSVGAAPYGYVRATARLVFDRIVVPLVVTLRPEPSATELRFKISARAGLDFGNRFLQWISDKLGGDGFATRLAQRQIDDGLIGAFAPPPPFELPGGQRIAFGYCSDPPEIVEGAYGALPFTVELGRAAQDPAILPPRRGPAPRAPLAPNAAFGIDLDLDALNALLYELWRSGYLDRQLAAAGLDRRFNEDPLVTELLSLRISPPRLALPPVLAPVAPGGLRLSAEARVALTDGPPGGAPTAIGRVWGGLDFGFARRVDEPLSVDLGALELSCERAPSTLVPCYADLVAAMRDRGPDFHGALTQAFAGLIADLFVDRRLGATGVPLELVIRAATPGVRFTPPAGDSPANASLHLDLDATLVTPP
jgi:hypothetical protein